MYGRRAYAGFGVCLITGSHNRSSGEIAMTNGKYDALDCQQNDKKPPEGAASAVNAVVIRNTDLQVFHGKIKKYINNENPEQFKPETIIKDVIYLLGISVDDKFAWANGFDDFKKEVEKALSV